MTHERLLRILTLVSAGVTLPLMIATNVVSLQQEARYHHYWSRRYVTTFCFGYIPLFVTAVASITSLLHRRKYGTAPGALIAYVDAVAILTYLAILLPIWIIEIDRLAQPGWAVLATYTTVPMLFSLFAHMYLFGYTLKKSASYNLKSILALFTPESTHECPNCHNHFTVGASRAQETRTAPEGYSLLRGEVFLDDDAVPSADTRDSDDHIRPEAETKGGAKGRATDI